MGEFLGKRILVTGGGNGLGKTIVQTFLEENATVFALDKDKDALDYLKKEFPNVNIIQVDLGDWGATRKAIEAVTPLDHLVNNAAISRVKEFLDITPEELDSCYSINLKAVVNVSQAFARGVGSKGGTIVNISSDADRTAILGFTSYSIMKAGLTMLTKNMALELGPLGIRVNCIQPTGIPSTNMFLNTVADPKIWTAAGEMMGRAIIKQTLETKNVADLVIFLSSSKSSMITGEAVAIDKGIGIT